MSRILAASFTTWSMAHVLMMRGHVRIDALYLHLPPRTRAVLDLVALVTLGIVAAAMLSFALSLDDFIITYFVSGSTVTYPLYVNAATKAAVPPQINVLATAILLISLVLLMAGTLYRRKRVDTA